MVEMFWPHETEIQFFFYFLPFQYSIHYYYDIMYHPAMNFFNMFHYFYLYFNLLVKNTLN